jgi:hypothetical protein
LRGTLGYPAYLKGYVTISSNDSCRLLSAASPSAVGRQPAIYAFYRKDRALNPVSNRKGIVKKNLSGIKIILIQPKNIPYKQSAKNKPVLGNDIFKYNHLIKLNLLD